MTQTPRQRRTPLRLGLLMLTSLMLLGACASVTPPGAGPVSPTPSYSQAADT